MLSKLLAFAMLFTVLNPLKNLNPGSLFLYLLGIIVSLQFISCQKKSIQPISVELLEMNTNLDLEKILFIDDSVGYVVGGNRFTESGIWFTTDGGQHWQMAAGPALATGKKIYAIDQFQNNPYAAGLDGKLYFSLNDSINYWYFHQIQAWKIIKGMSITASDAIYLAYGVAFQNGGILKVDTEGQILQHNTFGFELSAIHFINSEIGYACGYGAILKTENAGEDWKHLNIIGDFFKAIASPDPQNIWVVGYEGSIVHSKNAGDKWEKQRNGNSLFQEKWHLNAVSFVNINEGYAVGEKGLIIQTLNGGKSWNVIQQPYRYNLHGLYIKNNVLWATGTEGTLLKVQL